MKRGLYQGMHSSVPGYHVATGLGPRCDSVTAGSAPFMSATSLPPGGLTNNVGAPSVTNAISNDNSQFTAMSNHLFKRDLFLNRLVNFDDNAENYLSWKFSFKNVMMELGVSATEEFDLLIKYLGKGSSKSALSMKNSNPHDPACGLSLLWLDERFGSAELVESALKNKLNKFPKIAKSQPKCLYDLSDILAEVKSIKNYPGYQPLFSYFNTSAGINPIVYKLPPNIQSKWMDKAMAYKSHNAAVHPPFSEFCVFVRQISMRFNDPGLLVEPDVPQSTPTIGGGGKSVSHGPKQYQSQSVSAIKTCINSSSTKLMCPMHKGADHLLSDCRTLRKMSLWDCKRILRDANVCFKCCNSSSQN